MHPGVRAVVHNHSPGIIPFGITGTPLRPVMHMCASMGAHVPIWDSRAAFGDTNLLVTNMVMGRDLAAALGNGSVALMRGHGCVVAGASLREVVFNSVYLELNAELQLKAAALGTITFLTDGEIEAVRATRSSFTYERAWEDWCRRAGREDRLPPDGRAARSRRATRRRLRTGVTGQNPGLGGHQLLPPLGVVLQELEVRGFDHRGLFGDSLEIPAGTTA